MTISKYNKLRELMSQNKLDKVITLLMDVASKNFLNDVIIQSAQYNELKNLVNQERISFEQANLVRNKIRYALLNLIDKLEHQQNAKKV